MYCCTCSVVEQCRDRTVPRARTQRKEGSIRALVWSYCSRALSSDQGMNIERSNPAWPELFRPSPPSPRVLVSPLPSSLLPSFSLSSVALSRCRGTRYPFLPRRRNRAVASIRTPPPPLLTVSPARWH